MSASEFQNELVSLTAEIILSENRILSLSSSNFEVKKSHDREELGYEPCCINNTFGDVVGKGG